MAALLVLACSILACCGSINSHSATRLFVANAPGAAPVGHLVRVVEHGNVRFLVRQDALETDWPASAFFRALGPLQQCVNRAVLFTEIADETPTAATASTTYDTSAAKLEESGPLRIESQLPSVTEGGQGFTHRYWTVTRFPLDSVEPRSVRDDVSHVVRGLNPLVHIFSFDENIGYFQRSFVSLVDGRASDSEACWLGSFGSTRWDPERTWALMDDAWDVRNVMEELRTDGHVVAVCGVEGAPELLSQPILPTSLLWFLELPLDNEMDIELLDSMRFDTNEPLVDDAVADPEGAVNEHRVRVVGGPRELVVDIDAECIRSHLLTLPRLCPSHRASSRDRVVVATSSQRVRVAMCVDSD